MPRLRSILSATILITLAVGGISFFAAPWFALGAVRDAAKAGDAGALAGLVDVNALRASFRGQIGPDGPRIVAGLLSDPLATFSRPPAPDVEGYLTPAGMAFLADAQPKDRKAPFRIGDLVGLHGVEMRHWGWREARFAVLAPGPGDEESLFTFRRHGLYDWRLTHVRLPGPVER